jgi:hypothetical protein
MEPQKSLLTEMVTTQPASRECHSGGGCHSERSEESLALPTM